MDQLRRLNDNLENEKNQISAISRNVNFLLKNPFFIETKNRQSNNGKGVIFKKKKGKCIQNSENMNNLLKNSPTTFNDTRKKKIDVEQIEDAPSNFNSIHRTVYENEDINQTVSYITELQLKNHLEFLGEIDANPRNEISNKDIKTQTLQACRKAATETDVIGRKPSLSECSKPAVRRAKNSNIQSKARSTHDLLVKDAEAKCKCETEKTIRSVKDCSDRTSSETKHFNDIIVKCNTIHKVKASSQQVNEIEEDGSVDDETLQPVELLLPVTSDIKQTPDFSNNGHLFKKHSPCKHATQRNEALRSQLFQAELVSNPECFMKRKFMDVLQSHSVRLVPHLMRSSLAPSIKKKLCLLWLYECIILLLASENRSERYMHLNKLFLKNEKNYRQMTRGQIPKNQKTQSCSFQTDRRLSWSGYFVTYNQPRQLIVFLHLKERLSLLYFDYFVMTLVRRYLSDLNRARKCDRYIYSMYRSLHSIVNYGGRHVPCIVQMT